MSSDIQHNRRVEKRKRAATGSAPYSEDRSARARAAVEAAEAEGLELQRSEENPTGYVGVNATSSKANPFKAQVRREGRKVHLGQFPTAEEAALAVARAGGGAKPTGHSGPIAATKQEAEAQARAALGQAEAEGLILQRSDDNQAGFAGVRVEPCSKVRPFQAKVWRDGKEAHLGSFATAEEAALAVARAGGAANRGKTSGPVPRTADEAEAFARAAEAEAEAEGLTLQRASNQAGFYGVTVNSNSKGRPFVPGLGGTRRSERQRRPEVHRVLRSASGLP